jgi:hypothetical protein
VKSFLFLFPVLLVSLASCATAPSAEEIGQKVAALLGEPRDPGTPDLRLTVEPTGIRWTILRNQGEVLQTSGEKAIQALPDALLGIEFGHGLFLDSRGNLSLLPLSLWPDQWSAGVKYDAVVSQDLWTSNLAKPLGVEMTPQGLVAYRSGLLGSKSDPIDMQGREITALGSTVEKRKDNSWKESYSFQLFQSVQAYEKDDSGITHTYDSILGNSVQYYYKDKNIESSNKKFSIIVEKDHWTIRWNNGEWRLYLGTDKVLLLNTRTGETALVNQVPNGTTLTSSKGNQETVLAKN